MKTAGTVIGIAITTPIFIYIVWYVLKAIEASELTMFLFYVYVPLLLLVKILFSIAEWTKEHEEKNTKSFKERLKEKQDERNK